MKPKACHRGLGSGLVLALATVAVVVALQGPSGARADEVVSAIEESRIVMSVDRARVIRLPERTATLVVGNPLIADASVQAGGIAVITAKSYGATNLVALDRTGATLANHVVQVVGPADRVVVVYRGVDRESYSCMPKCERRITIGDTPTYFTANLGQLTAFSAQALGQATPK